VLKITELLTPTPGPLWRLVRQAGVEVLGREFSVAADEPSGYGAAMLGASAAGGSLPYLAARTPQPLAGAGSADASFTQFIAATHVSLAAVRSAPGQPGA
jgi:hypothetical protein